MTPPIKRILITAGEPAGIGPDITIHAAQKTWAAELVVVADPALLKARAQQINLPLTLTPCDLTSTPSVNAPGQLKYLAHASLTCSAPVVPGKLNIQNSAYVMQSLQLAADYCLQHQADAIVTGPVHKAVMNDAGIPFSGHTEFLAHAANVDRTLMLFVAKETAYADAKPLLVALATTHLPLNAISAAITPANLQSAYALLRAGLQTYFHLENPTIFICGLNPHAGENGHLGREEIEVITPFITAQQQQHHPVEGPFSADTLFLPQQCKRADAILAMYHDQALPVIKYASFGHAVNVTLGLPFIRTSVDHGTALNIAATPQIDPASLYAAIQLSIEMSSAN